MRRYKQYYHWGNKVWVNTDLKGQHREHCLCWNCALFTPEDRERNCTIANMVFALCCLQNLTLPVWECPDFVCRDGEATEQSVRQDVGVGIKTY